MLRGGGLRLDLPLLPDRADRGAPEPSVHGPPAATPLPTTHLPSDAQRGERLRLHVHVKTIKKTFQVMAQLLDLRRRSRSLHAVVGFLPESPPDDLLDAVWADGLNVPQRRSRRHGLRGPVRFACLTTGEVNLRPGELRNLSLGGCCVAGSALPPRGSHVLVELDSAALNLPAGGAALGRSLHLTGRVRWTERPAAGLMGIEFQGPSAALAELLQALG
jgi:hypothetical protein